MTAAALVHRLTGGGGKAYFIAYENTAISGNEMGGSLTKDFEEIAKVMKGEDLPPYIVIFKGKDVKVTPGHATALRARLPLKRKHSESLLPCEEKFGKRVFLEGKQSESLSSCEEPFKKQLHRVRIPEDNIIYAGSPL